jgi:hypothetical protein
VSYTDEYLLERLKTTERRGDNEREHIDADAEIVLWLRVLGYTKSADWYEAKSTGEWWYA